MVMGFKTKITIHYPIVGVNLITSCLLIRIRMFHAVKFDDGGYHQITLN
jgi:hypothetical protein